MSAEAAASSTMLAALTSLYKLNTVQKSLELGAIALLGALVRARLDASALTALLLKALVPAVILSSLAGLSVSPELTGFVGGGALLVLLQIVAGQIASRALLGGRRARAATRRTAAIQVGTMAPVLSVFAFIREFVGEARTGYAALVDLPSKTYTLVLMPLVLLLVGDPAGRAASAGTRKPTLRERVSAAGVQLSDPFNAAILLGLLMAGTGTRVADLGFLGAAVRTLASAQTPVLFLLIGMKFQLSGARPAFVLALLLARHGLIALAMSGFLRLANIVEPGARLAAVLSSQAAASIVAFGQIDAAAKRSPALGFDSALAFEIVTLSFPLSVVLNTVACVAGAAYVDSVGKVGLALLAASAAVYAANRCKIDDM
jgi:hypothetical protein